MIDTNGNGSSPSRARAALAVARRETAAEAARLEVLRRLRSFTNAELIALARGRISTRREATRELYRRGLDDAGQRLAKRAWRAARQYLR